MGKIVKLIKRHHCGCFDVMDEHGNFYLVQLAFKLEEAWQAHHKN